jgi:hypothetical protein
MIQRVLGIIAGVDRKTLASCPASDKLWATHLGASLCLSFVVVLGVSFHATGYMIGSVWTRLMVSGVIALTVLMFDRALCQSDWFYQGTLWNTAPIQSSAEAKQTAWRFVRVGVRLALSFGLAWVIAMFLELAIFSSTINEKIEADRVAANQPIYTKIATYEAGLNAEAKRRQADIEQLEALHRAALTEQPAPDPTTQTRADDVEQQIRSLAAREAGIRSDIAEIDKTIQRYIGDMNAEEFGMKASPNNSGRPGAGPRYEFAKKQRQAFLSQRAEREAEIAQLHARRDDLRAVQARITADAMAGREQERAAIKAKADALQRRVDAARADLKQFEVDKAVDIAAFRKKVMGDSYYQEKKDKFDPLTRIAAYQELKNDPRDGATMTLFSWMTRFFIIFLEIVPVVAKIFFSPPSVYAAKIQAQVERARQRIENNEDIDDDKPSAPAPAPAMAAITLPPMALDPVTIAKMQPAASEPPRQPAPPPEPVYYEQRRREPLRQQPRDRNDEPDDYAPRAYTEREVEPRREARRGYERRRAGAHDDYEPDYGDFDRAEFDRPDFIRRDDDRDHDRRRREPARRSPPQFVARDYATQDFGGREHDEPEFDASEIDVRNLIMPRRGAARREVYGHEPTGRIRVQGGEQPMAAEVAERSLRWPEGIPVDDHHTRELVRQVLAEAGTPVAEPVTTQPVATEPVAVAAAAGPLPDAVEVAPASAEPVTAAAVPPAAPAEPQPAVSAIEEPDLIPNLLAPQRAAAPAASETGTTPLPMPAEPAAIAAAPPEAVAPAAPEAGAAVPKYSADVEKLMTEAVELSRARKKPAHPRHHRDDEAELPLDHTPHYDALPKQ